MSLDPNEAMQLVLVGTAEHNGKTRAMRIGDPDIPSGQSKGMHPVYMTRAAIRANEAAMAAARRTERPAS